MRNRDYRNHPNNAIAGLLLLGIGGVWLYRQLGFYVPDWLFTWPMILIAIGLFVGIRNNFSDFGWLIMVGIGLYFLVDDWWPEIPMRHYIWPIIIIGAGLALLLVPRRSRRYWKRYLKEGEDKYTGTPETKKETTFKNKRDEELDVVSIFAGIKKTIYSKNFLGGDVVCIFGGADINLSQADFEGILVLDFVHIFGGSKLIIPPHWELRTEAAVVFGGIDDKRKAPQQPYDHSKVVILKGAIIFGGVEIRSY